MIIYLFFVLSAGLLLLLLTVIFKEKLTYGFLFLLPLTPRYLGIDLGGGLPYITATRVLIVYYVFFFLLFYRKTMMENVKKIKMKAMHASIVIFILINGVICAANVNDESTKYYFSLLFENVALFYLIYISISDARKVRKCVDALLLASLIIACLSMVEFATGFNIFSSLGGIGGYTRLMSSNLIRTGHARVYGPFSHPIAQASYVLLIFPFAFNFFLKTKDKTKKYFYGICSVLLVGNLILTLSRGPLLCFFGGFVIFFVALEKKEKMFIFKLAAPSFAALVLLIKSNLLPGFLQDWVNAMVASLTGGYVDDFGSNLNPFDYRTRIFIIAKNLLEDHWILGRGMVFLRVNKVYDFDYRFNPFYKYLVDSIDNFYVLKTIEGGLLGLFSYLLIIGVATITTIKGIRANQNRTSKMICQAMLFSAASYFTSLISVDELGTMKFFWILAGLTIYSVEHLAAEQTEGLEEERDGSIHCSC